MEKVDYTEEFPIIENTFSAYRVKGLGQVNEGNTEGSPLFTVFFLYLSICEDCIFGGPASHEAAMGKYG